MLVSFFFFPLCIWAEQLAACNMVKAHTICLDMTITQANYCLVYRQLASNLMFSRHACPTSNPSLYKPAQGGIDREEGWRAWGQNLHCTQLSD